jgi:glucosamine kinase
MNIIADSGSTKTAWRLITDNNKIVAVETPGINPYYQTKREISDSLKVSLLPHISGKVGEIYFYGAGCTGGEKSDLVTEAISEVISTSVIEVNSDLLGAARALCGNSPGIACILGTGSNSCYYDGKKIIRNISPLGFILGDEGSAAVLGKRLVADYLKNIMPSPLRFLFEKEYSVMTSDALNNVYRAEFPNRYLSGFAPFLSKNIKDSYCEKLIVSEFQEFITRNVLNYKECRETLISFTGSVAYYFKNQLNIVLQSNGLMSGKIVQHPIDLLAEYHQTRQ